MNMKKVISSIMATTLVASFASVAAFAAAPTVTTGDVFNNDGQLTTELGSLDVASMNFTADPIAPNTTFYIALGEDDAEWDGIRVDQLVNKDLFKFSINKDENSKLISSITLVNDKKFSGYNRANFIKVVLNDSNTTSEIKSNGTVSFKAKKLPAGASWDLNKEIKFSYTLWINNKIVSGSDGSAGTGDRVYFDPTSNEENTFVWGDDRAALKFDANDDASKFYARLSTKASADIYADYGDPVDADLWFYDFVGNPTIPSTSRATLTLGLGWDEDSDYTPNPADCFIYEQDADGVLTDVTNKFTYSEDDNEIAGWSIKTRTLGTYIVSDTELDLDAVEADKEESESESSSSKPTTSGDKEIPNTGSSDMVNVAVVAAVVSLAAAGAVAFKKVSK